MKPKTIRDSFKVTGIYPFHYPTILSNLKADKGNKLTNIEIDKCLETLPVVLKKFREKGHITDEEMDGIGLPNNMNTDKDNVVLNRCRSSILTHTGFVEKEIVPRSAKKEQKKKTAKKSSIRKVGTPPLNSTSMLTSMVETVSN